MGLSTDFHLWCKSRRLVEIYLDILVLNHSPLFPVFQRIFMSVGGQRFTTDIRQDIEILQNCGLETVYVNRGN